MPIVLSAEQKCFPYLDYFLITESVWSNKNFMQILILAAGNMLLCPRCYIAHNRCSSVLKLKQNKKRLTHTCHAKRWPTPPSGWWWEEARRNENGHVHTAIWSFKLTDFSHVTCYPPSNSWIKKYFNLNHIMGIFYYSDRDTIIGVLSQNASSYTM